MQVANCYVHLRYRRLERREFDRFSERLMREAAGLAVYVKRGQYLDYTFEEGSLFQRIVVIGALTLGAVHQYHDLRESIIDMAHDAETLSIYAIEKFHEITGTTPADNIYTRKSSRDLNRLGPTEVASHPTLSALKRHEIGRAHPAWAAVGSREGTGSFAVRRELSRS